MSGMWNLRRTMLRLGAWAIGLVMLVIGGGNDLATAFDRTTITDNRGVEVSFATPPARVVSLAPSLTEMVIRIGAADRLSGITYHSADHRESAGKEIVGGFFNPSFESIIALAPDLVLTAPVHRKLATALEHRRIPVVEFETRSIQESFEAIREIGRLFKKEARAAEIVAGISSELELIAEKIAGIPPADRKRVIRMMGRDQVMTPGADSFQNELIRAAGGIPPDFTSEGKVVPVDREAWIRFNPQVIYGCDGDRKLAERFFDQPGWGEVEAVRNQRIYYFPCDLTCRVATHTGYFVSWLAARIYPVEFSDPDRLVFPETKIGEKPLPLEFGYVRAAAIVESRIFDFASRTLVIDFDQPMTVVSTLEGQRTGIRSVGNHYMPPQTWGLGHEDGLDALKRKVFSVVHRPPEISSFLFTGAHMDHLARRQAAYKDMKVTAYVTAGVRSNALRMSRDAGGFYEPGTINMIILTNMQLSPRAMTRAIVSATEAKTAALTDLDVRSSYSPLRSQATGTGTDNIIVVQGVGPAIDNSGGHSKMGELIATAVYDGVVEAIHRQNGLTVPRPIFSRLSERRLGVSDLLKQATCDCFRENEGTQEVEDLLQDEDIAGFIEASFALSDAHERGLLKDLTAYRVWCNAIATRIAGQDMHELENLVAGEDLPPVLKMAWNAVLTGVKHRGDGLVPASETNPAERSTD